MDLIRDYALPLPTTIIAEMLGVPARDRHRFHRWSNTLLSALPNAWGMLKAMPSVLLFLRYIRKLIKSRRDQPGDDLTSALVQARESGDQLSEDELLSMVFPVIDRWTRDNRELDWKRNPFLARASRIAESTT